MEKEDERYGVHGAAPVVDIVGWLREGWRIFRKSPGAYMLASLIFVVVMLLSHGIPVVGAMLTAGPMFIGFYLVVADLIAARPFNPGRLFAGFFFFVPAFLANLVIGIFSTIGFMLLFLPGVVIGSWYLFTFLFIADRDMDFWAAMEASREVAFRDIAGFALFYVAIITLNGIGLLFFFVGVLVTVPVTTIATLIAYDRTAGVRKILAPVAEPAEDTS